MECLGYEQDGNTLIYRYANETDKEYKERVKARQEQLDKN